MNPRSVFLSVLGWCPGVKAAANFLPDKDVPNRRIVFSMAVVVLVAATSYMVTYSLLANAGIQNASIDLTFTSPQIGVKNGQMYLAVGQQTSGSSNPFTGPDYLHMTIYFSELLSNGTLRNTQSLAEVERGGRIAQSLLATSDGEWLLAYTYNQIDVQSTSGSAIYLVNSDGGYWGKPNEAYPSAMVSTPSLLETGDGSQFLLFRSGGGWYYMMGDDGVWGEAKVAPFASEVYDGEYQYESAFLDREGRVNVVWDEGDAIGSDLGLRYCTLDNGVWSEVKMLTSDSALLKGQNPRIFYSSIRDRFYLTVTPLKDTGGVSVTQLLYSEDFASWTLLSYFPSWKYSITELPDGSLVRVILDKQGFEGLFLDASLDGVGWSTPVKISQIEDGDVLTGGATVWRSNFSFAVSFVVSLLMLLVFSRVSIVK